MNEVLPALYEQLPMLFACVALLLGALLGQRIAKRYLSTGLWLGAIACLFLCFVFGDKLTAGTIRLLMDIGVSDVIARYAGVSLLSLIGGTTLGIWIADAGRGKAKA